MIDLPYAPTPNGWKISILLEELGLPYTVVPIDIRAGEQFSLGGVGSNWKRLTTRRLAGGPGPRCGDLGADLTAGSPCSGRWVHRCGLDAARRLQSSGRELFTIGTSTIVHLSPGAAIGKITAVHFAWVGITGTAIAPTLVAVVAEQFFQGTLGSALSTVDGALATIGGLCLLVVYRQLRPGDSVPSLARDAAQAKPLGSRTNSRPWVTSRLSHYRSGCSLRNRRRR